MGNKPVGGPFKLLLLEWGWVEVFCGTDIRVRPFCLPLTRVFAVCHHEQTSVEQPSDSTRGGIVKEWPCHGERGRTPESNHPENVSDCHMA
jgi:hypothetical protein